MALPSQPGLWAQSPRSARLAEGRYRQSHLSIELIRRVLSARVLTDIFFNSRSLRERHGQKRRIRNLKRGHPFDESAIELVNPLCIRRSIFPAKRRGDSR